MAVTTTQTVDVTSALETLLNSVEGLRAYRYVADNVRVPAAVIAMPSVTFNDPDSGFHGARWEFPVSLIVSRNADRAAQDALARMLSEVAQAIWTTEVDGVYSIEATTAVPVSITVSGQELPAYTLRVIARA